MESHIWSTLLVTISALLINSTRMTDAEGRVIASRRRMMGLEGSSMTLPCPDYKGGSISTLGWYRDNDNLVNTQPIRRGSADEATTGHPIILSNGSLALFNLTLMDERWYTCDFMTSNSIYLEIIVIPDHSEISAGSRPIVEGEKQDLNCTIERVKPADNVTFVWYLNNVALNGVTSSRKNADMTTEMIDTLTHTFNVSHEGQPITCSMTFNKTFTLNTTHTLNIFVMPNEVSILQPDVLVDDGTMQTVSCRVGRIKPHNATITWSFDNRPQKQAPGETRVIDRDDGTFTLVGNFSYRFNMSDNGRQLRCTVSSGLQGIQPTSTTATLTVFEPGNATSIKVSGNPLRGGNFTMTCTLIGTNLTIPATASYRWYYNRTSITQDTGNMRGSSTGALTFSRLRSDDNGIYTCAIRTGKGWTMGAKNYTLTAWYAPIVWAVGPSVAREGMNVTLTCSADYYPRDNMKVHWSLNDDMSDGRTWDTSNMNYAFPEIHGSDSGTYRCGVCNAVDCGWSQPITLDVLSTPHWTGGARFDASELGERGKHLTCNVSANPPVHNYTWTYSNGGKLRAGISNHDNTLDFDTVNSADYTNYTCTTFNIIDGKRQEASFNIELRKKGPPGAPLDFKVVNNVTSRSISLSWRPGSDGSYPPQRFLIQYQAGNGSERTDVSVDAWEDAEEMGHTLYHLTANTNYSIWIQAYNQRPALHGNNASEVLLQKTTTIGLPRLAVRHLQVEPNSVSVFWVYTPADGSQPADKDHLCVRLQTEETVLEECRILASANQYAFRGEFREDHAYSASVELYEGNLSTPSLENNRTSVPTGLTATPESKYMFFGIGAGAVVIALVLLVVLYVTVRKRGAKKAKKDILRPKNDLVMDRQSRRSSIYQYIDPDDVAAEDEVCRPPAPPPRLDDRLMETAEPNIYSYSSLPKLKSDNECKQPAAKNAQPVPAARGAHAVNSKRESDYLQPVKIIDSNPNRDSESETYLEPVTLKRSKPKEGPMEGRDSDYLLPRPIGSNPTYGINNLPPRADSERSGDEARQQNDGNRLSRDKDASNRPTSAVF